MLPFGAPGNPEGAFEYYFQTLREVVFLVGTRKADLTEYVCRSQLDCQLIGCTARKSLVSHNSRHCPVQQPDDCHIDSSRQ